MLFVHLGEGITRKWWIPQTTNVDNLYRPDDIVTALINHSNNILNWSVTDQAAKALQGELARYRREDIGIHIKVVYVEKIENMTYTLKPLETVLYTQEGKCWYNL